MMQQFFSALSYLFHPLLMPILGLYILFEAPTIPYSFLKMDALYFFPEDAKRYLFIVMGILTLIAPLLSLFIMKKNGMISSFKLEKKEERIYPMIITLFYYILAFIYVRYQIPEGYQHPALLGFLFGAVLIFITAIVINFFIKISLHTLAIFALIGGLIAYFQSQNLMVNHDRMLFFLIFLIFIGGLVGAGRIYLKAHTLVETTMGMFIGFVLSFASVSLSIKFGFLI